MSSPRTITRPPYTYADLTRLTGVPAGTLRQWKLRGILPAPTREVGGSPVWDRMAIEDWLNEHPLSPAPGR